MSTVPDVTSVPTIADVERTRRRLRGLVRETPVWRWEGAEAEALVGDGELWVKLELWQHAGSFKARGALNVMLELDEGALSRGVTAVSAGNHAIAVAHAARVLGTTAKVVMPKTADPGRIAKCRAAGAEVILVADVHTAFEEVQRIARREDRTFVHPFEGRGIVLGTATIGLELVEQIPGLDAVVVPVGGGGLAAGIACAVKQLRAGCTVHGVEPHGASSMHRSLTAGSPQAIEAVRTIADSLGAPRAEPYTFELCRRFLDGVALVSDDELVAAMRRLFDALKLAVEPAAAASTAAAFGPLRSELRGRCVALILCGTNTDVATFCRTVQR